MSTAICVFIGIIVGLVAFYIVERWTRREEAEDYPTVASVVFGAVAGVICGFGWPVLLALVILAMIVYGFGYVLKFIYTGIIRFFEKRDDTDEKLSEEERHFYQHKHRKR